MEEPVLPWIGTYLPFSSDIWANSHICSEWSQFIFLHLKTVDFTQIDWISEVLYRLLH